MLEAITGGILAIVLGIAANILTPHVEDKLRLNRPKNPPKPKNIEQPLENATDEELEAWRAQNRRKRELFWWQVYVYGASFFAVYMSINLPLNFSAGIGTEGLDFSSTRFPFNGYLAKEHFSFISAALGILLYIPCWYVAQQVANLVTAFALRYGVVSEIRYGAFIALGMFFMALLIAGHTVYLLNPMKGYVESVLLPFMVLFFVAMFASSRR